MKTSNIFFLIFLCFVVFFLFSWKCSQRQIIIHNIYLGIPEELITHKETLRKEIIENISTNKHFIINKSDQRGVELKLFLSPQPEDNSILLKGVLLDPKVSESNQKKYKAWTKIELPNGELTKENFLRELKKILGNLSNLNLQGGLNNEYYIDMINKKLNGEYVSQTDLFNAITILQDLNDKNSKEVMIKLLKNCDDLSLGNTLMMALGNIGEENAMPAIIDFAARKPPIIRRQAIIAAKKIASKLSAEWLLVMAYGYSDPVVKKEAKEALEIVEKKLRFDKN